MRVILITGGSRGNGVILTYRQNLQAALDVAGRNQRKGGLTPEFEAPLASRTALRRIGEPEDVARVITSLRSDRGRWINGQSIEAAGGHVV